ncbi:hypothetical protein [Rhizobium giardinii]|uniref:hypothetical protein n=1 Tax=Rhizobium giardinii TaxID=56731 RepID=UPI003D6E16A7
MRINRIAGLIACVVGITTATTGVLAQDSTKTPHIPLEKTIGSVKPTGPVPSLAVINSQGAKIEGEKLILTGVSASSIVFADRPVRAAGHVATEQFIMQWDEGKDSFAVDPPNATISVLGGGGAEVSDVVVTLKSPKLEGNTLTFDIAVLEGSLGEATGSAAVFIDHFAGGFGGGGFRAGGFGGGEVHGGYARVGDVSVAHVGGAYWHAPVYHGAWYRGAPVAAGVAVGAAVGAAAANPYYYPSQCGYYPLPPCY